MNKPYLIFVNGVLAKRKVTLGGANKYAREMESKGYQRVSVAYEFEQVSDGIKRTFIGGH